MRVPRGVQEGREVRLKKRELSGCRKFPGGEAVRAAGDERAAVPLSSEGTVGGVTGHGAHSTRQSQTHTLYEQTV